MEVSWNRPALRVGALLLAATAWHAPAWAQSQITYTSSPAGKVTNQSQTTSYLQVEGFDTNGNQVETYQCITPNACAVRFGPAVVSTATTLQGFNGGREEIVGETCNGVVSTVPIGRCNGTLKITLRVRSGGKLKTPLSTTDNGRPFLNYTSKAGGGTAVIRFEFLEDATKHWDYAFPGNVVSGERYVENMPAGSYRVYADPLAGNCKPVHHNPGVVVDVPEGGGGSVSIVYRGTDCTISVESQSDVPANVATITSEPAGFSCDARATSSTCRMLVPYGTPLRLNGNTIGGWTTYFPFVNNNCHERNRDNPVFCDVDVRSDSVIKVNFGEAAAPPPPPPVALAAATGPAAAASASAAKGAGNVPMLQLRLTPANGSASVTSLTVEARGDGRDDLDLTAVRVFVDSNGNGRVDAGETALASGQIASDNGSLKLTLAAPLTVAAPLDLLVTADVADSIHVAAAAAASLGGVALALFAAAVPATRARRWRTRSALAGAAAVLLGLAACGGGGGGAVEAEPEPEVVVPPPPVVANYQLIATGIEATTTGPSPTAIAVDALPVQGTVVSVTQ